MPLNPTRLRTVVERWLTDTCVIRSPGLPVYDPDEGVDTITAGDIVYEGACRLRPTGGDRIVMAGDAPISLRLFDLTLPWDTTGIMVNQQVTVTVSNDPHIVDRAYRVTDVVSGTDSAYRRVIVEDTLTVDEGEEGS